MTSPSSPDTPAIPEIPVKTFAELGVNEQLDKILVSIGYTSPTPVQEETIPIALSGADLIGQAETGSGKTAACAIPATQLIDVENRNPQVLVLTPTRELAKQYLQEFHTIAGPLGIECFVVYGGFDRAIQTAKLKNGVHVVVATTGRVMDLIYTGDIEISHIKLLVLDEADEMLDMGFVRDIDFVMSCLVQKHQTLLFSATMPPAIKKLTQKYIGNADHIVLNKNKKTPKNLNHSYILTENETTKLGAICNFIDKTEITQALIFCNMRKNVEILFRQMYKKRYDIKMLHGGMEQATRDRVTQAFKDEKLKFIVATDVMARGLDYDGISHVIHYDLPSEKESYIHRSGRAARLGRKGEAVTILVKRDIRKYKFIMSNSSVEPTNIETGISGFPTSHSRPHPTSRNRPGKYSGNNNSNKNSNTRTNKNKKSPTSNKNSSKKSKTPANSTGNVKFFSRKNFSGKKKS